MAYLLRQMITLLLSPWLYMNLSGDFVSKIAKFYKISLEDILIIYDDMDQDLGKYLIRQTWICQVILFQK